ncbi:hypothetical protein KCP77_04525 [Salmonella enterica subsp. enterica]|nr:hypothetical protein KCP77_04525 [Salmonella enterica subsp. enterica]
MFTTPGSDSSFCYSLISAGWRFTPYPDYVVRCTNRINAASGMTITESGGNSSPPSNRAGFLLFSVGAGAFVDLPRRRPDR